MILPLYDRPRVPGGWPVVTIALVLLNVLILVAALPGMWTGLEPTDPGYMDAVRALGRARGAPIETLPAYIRPYDWVAARFGFIPGAPSVVGLFTSMFLHGGVAHLVGNMIFLGVYGGNVERRLGSVAFGLAYVATGAIATGTFALASLGTHVPLIGASGAISGILGIHFAALPANRTQLLVGFPPVFYWTTQASSRAFLSFFVVVDNVMPLLSSASSNVAYGAHLGGFAAGLALGAVLSVRERAEGEPVSPADEPGPAAVALARGRELARAGLLLDAWQAYQQVIDSDDPGAAEVARSEQGALALSAAQLERIGDRSAAPRAAREDSSRPL